MKRLFTKNALTLLALILAIAVLHALQSFQRSNNIKSPIGELVIKKPVDG